MLEIPPGYIWTEDDTDVLVMLLDKGASMSPVERMLEGSKIMVSLETIAMEKLAASHLRSQVLGHLRNYRGKTVNMCVLCITGPVRRHDVC